MNVPWLEQFKSVSEARRALQRDNKDFGKTMQEVPIPPRMSGRDRAPEKAFRSREFLAQYFTFEACERLSINRANLNSSGAWTDGITWDELQRVKSECGFGYRIAVEIYPEDGHVVYDANMRHLWLLKERPNFAWK